MAVKTKKYLRDNIASMIFTDKDCLSYLEAVISKAIGVDENIVKDNLILKSPRINSNINTEYSYVDAIYENNTSIINIEINYNDNMYVGFKYTSGQVHGLGTKSNILTELEKWYIDNLKVYASEIDMNAGFCGDRTTSTSQSAINNSGGTGVTTTWYGAYIRLYTNKVPTLKCLPEDLYTVSGTPKGNKSLDYPIGLITADEVALAGGGYANYNYGYYLYNGQSYWTLSPYEYNKDYGTSASVFRVDIYGHLNSGKVHNVAASVMHDMRPVINLRSDIELTGTGASTDPYVVVGANS